MKTNFLAFFLCFSLTSSLAQVQSGGKPVSAEVFGSDKLFTNITVPTNAFSSNLIAVAITQHRTTYPLLVTDVYSQMNFTLGTATTTGTGSVIAIYYLVNAASGPHTINVSTGNGNITDIKTITTCYTGVDNVTPVSYATNKTNTVASNKASLNINCAADQMVVNAVVYEQPVVSALASGTQSMLPYESNNSQQLSASFTTSTSGNVNTSWDFSANQVGFWGAVALTFKATIYGILPGQLASFNGRIAGNNVELSWATNFETNVQYISVMRSADAKTWKEISRTAASSSSSIVKQYAAVDPNVADGNYFYKLIFISGDGKKSQSSVVSIKTSSDKKLRFANMPNPFRNELNVALYTDTDKDVVITISSNTGNVLARKTVKPLNGTIAYAVNETQNLKPGIYVLQCISEKETISKTIMKN